MINIDVDIKVIQDLSHIGFKSGVEILKLINNNAAAHYNTVQRHLALTK